LGKKFRDGTDGTPPGSPQDDGKGFVLWVMPGDMLGGPGSSETGQFGDRAVRRPGSSETGQFGDRAVRRPGNSETGQFGNWTVRKLDSSETGQFGNWAVRKLGSSETGQFGDRAVRKLGSSETGQFGDRAVRKPGSSETGQFGNWTVRVYVRLGRSPLFSLIHRSDHAGYGFLIGMVYRAVEGVHGEEIAPNILAEHTVDRPVTLDFE